MGILESLNRLDQRVFLDLAGQGGPIADAIFTAASSAWLALAIWMLLWASRRPDYPAAAWIWLLVTMVAAFAAADWTATLLKNSIGRPRPCWHLEGQFRALAQCKGKFGFVSGHSATTWAILAVFLASRPAVWIGRAAILWTLTVSFSRVYVGVHYPGDVLAGALLGLLIARVILLLRPLPSRL
jgi:undecaprenyl-diphosphatase